jgi:hypothetical protein
MARNNSEELFECGYIPHAKGVLLTKEAKLLFDLWQGYLSRVFESLKYEDYKAPIFIDKKILQRSHYLGHFPNQVIGAHGLKNPSKREYLTPAACLHIYPFLSGSELKSTFKSLIIAQCGRFENNKHKFPFRLSSFHMLEFVAVGSEKDIPRIRGIINRKLSHAFKSLKLSGSYHTATDAFFLDSKGSEVMQRLKKLKQEYTVNVKGQNIALASINSHEGYFGKLFNIKINEQHAHSLCAAFGLERLAAYSLVKWGPNPRKWPKEFKA